MDITDKHLLLLSVVSVSGLRGINCTVGGSTFNDCSVTMTGGNIINVFGFTGPIKFQNKPKPVFSVSFADGKLTKDKAIIPTLHQFAQLTSGIVDTIEKAYVTSSGSKAQIA